MTITGTGRRRGSRTLLAGFAAGWLAVCLLCLAIAPAVTYAGKEGVFLTDSVYFTLEEASVAAGSDYQSLQFVVQLNNNGAAAIDYNRFGVRVTAGASSFTAQMSRAGEALVPASSARSYAYVARIPSGVAAEELYVTISERVGSAGEIRDLGSLSVAKLETLQQVPYLLTVNVADADSALTGDAFVAFQSLRGFIVPQNGKWAVALNVKASNLGATAIAPAGSAAFGLRDRFGQFYPLSLTWTDSETIPAGGSAQLVLSATLDTAPDLTGARFEIARSATGRSVLGSVQVDALFGLSAIGESVPYLLQGTEGLSLQVSGASSQQLNDKRQALVTVTLHNGSPGTVRVPALKGVIASRGAKLAVDAATVLSPESFLEAGKTASYRFAADIPNGLAPEALQFMISETNNAAAAEPSSGIPVLAAGLDRMAEVASLWSSAPAYSLGQPMAIDQASTLIDDNLHVSVVALNSHTNPENGFQTVIAKFKFENRSSDTLALPSFATELVDASGVHYPGEQQTTALQQLIPNTAYVYSYSFLLPPYADGSYVLRLLDNSSTTSYKVPISSYRVTAANTDDNVIVANGTLDFYPFTVDILYWVLNQNYSNQNYTYKLDISLDVQKDPEVIVDQTFSTMELEIVDAQNRSMGSTVISFLGANKLTGGKQTIDFPSVKANQYYDPVYVNVYEVITTPSGTARRLVAVLK